MSEAFPRRPAPHHRPPTTAEIAQAQHDFAVHIPSLFTHQCLASGCGRWPCRPYRQAVAVLDRAGLLDVDGQLRDATEPANVVPRCHTRPMTEQLPSRWEGVEDRIPPEPG
ncbi:MAG: hypothetical protein ACRDTM_00740 [Micromonosporaceae bacterium]